MSAPVELRIGAWRFLWKGGRLMEVFHDASGEAPVDAITAGPYDWQTDQSSATAETVQAAAAEWVADHGVEYMDNVVRYRQLPELAVDALAEAAAQLGEDYPLPRERAQRLYERLAAQLYPGDPAAAEALVREMVDGIERPEA